MAITTWSELQRAIAALPEPREGTVRVFRGQTRDYPSLAPSGLRRPPRQRAIWSAYAAQLYASLVPGLIEKQGEVTLEDLQAFGLWFHALAQHYGPGSDFLDVSHAPEAALWFALHKTRVEPVTGTIGPDGPPDPVRDHPTRTSAVLHEPWTEDAYLYVLDLPAWNGEGLPEPGAVIDLRHAPDVFSSSARMRAQSGCLVYCRTAEGRAYDLRERLVGGAPLVVRRPMTGAPGLDRTVAEIFPSPAVDAWYRRFLSVPMGYAPEHDPPALARSIPVTVYLDLADRAYTDEVLRHDVAIPLPLAHRAIPEFTRDAGAPVAIVLEAPLVFPYPAADSDAWHHGLLSSDLADAAPWFTLGQDAAGGEVSLSDVLFEFSLLEDIGWEDVIDGKRRMRSLRGVWLRRHEGRIEAALLQQTIPGGDLERLGFMSLRYDAARARLVIDTPEPISFETVPDVAKPIMLALMLLRTLSPVLKLEPLARITTRGEDEKGGLQNQFELGVFREAARLYRVPAPPPNPNWYVLRDASAPDEPFTSITHPAASVRFGFPGALRDVPLEPLRALIPV